MSITIGSLAVTINVEAVIETAAAAFGVTPAELVGTGRRWPLSKYRQVAMRAARMGGHSYPVIGAAFGRDHTTVMHGCRRVEADPDLERRARIIADDVHNAPRSLF